jgi:folate-dependent phosphoribosylglycinamide formyltransferase PurN
MAIVCFVSGSGTNYQKIVERDRGHDYVIFTNRPGCEGVAKARSNGHPVIELSHIPYLKAARARYGPANVPRNCPERVKYEQDACRLIEERVGRAPDLVCLAGYDQWLTDWTVDRYYPRILNVHPGDTTKGYSGLHWIPAARAILAGEKELRTTLFIVDRGEDTGPVLAQSRPLDIAATLRRLEAEGGTGLVEGLHKVIGYAKERSIARYEDFEKTAGAEQKAAMRLVCEGLQNALKVAGDWEVYPFAVHGLIGRGRVEVEGRAVYVDGRRMPEHGYRMEVGA